MKLNLLPTTVTKRGQAKSSVVFSAIIAIVGIGASIVVAKGSDDALQKAKDDNSASQAPATAAYNKSQEADTIMQSATQLIRDQSLADKMLAHSTVYPDLYDSVEPYIPSFFRINSMSAVSNGAGSSTVTMVGTIKTYQQYADLMLCLSRYPGVVSVGRAGYQFNEDIVPNLTPVDQTGTPHKLNEAPVPDDRLARLSYFQSQATTSGYTGEGNFGSGTDNTRNAMPGYSLITVTMTVTKDLQVPQPRATLALSAAGGAGGGAAGGSTTASVPGLGGGGRSAASAPGGGTAPGAKSAAGGGKGKKGADDSGD